MKNFRLLRLLIIVSAFAVASIMASAEEVSKGAVTIQYEPMADGGIKVVNVWNRGDKRIDLKIDGKIVTVNANSSAQPNQYAARYVRYDYDSSSGDLLWRLPKKAPAPEVVPSVTAENAEDIESSNQPEIQNADITKDARHVMRQTEGGQFRQSAGSSVGYFDALNKDEFFGADAVTAFTQKVENLCRSISSSKNKSQFIIDNDVRLFLENSEKEISDKKQELSSTAKDIVRNSNVDAASQASALTLIVETLNSRLKTREEAYDKLRNAVADVDDGNVILNHSFDDNIVIYGIVAAIVIILIILVIVAVRRKREKHGNVSTSVDSARTHVSGSSDNPSIVVRRRTTSILKKQCIDDVVDNPSYLMINTSDFTPDSAVRTIFIKNSCIKEVYNLYAEDLRNTDNPKEDGCMVLGRWIHNEVDGKYDISLEEVVFPGDDAVFKEYELNFGGKIKLRIAEKLRKLRRDTGLQYDLVCWIHSHPGLGVFFSNSDNNVQMQLKHSQHPNFLIAFVVDILTANQEMGIFTFRKDGSMNSKGDITKMYSLEDLYKWALKSERNSFSPENYFNVLENAKLKLPACKGVQLNNSSIIDLTQIVIDPETGIVGWAVGTSVENKSGVEFAVSSIVRGPEKTGAGIIGCLICMTHMSLPSIQRLVARDIASLSFVMVFSSRLMSLTTIPVINGELLSDDQFYGDVNIDDLKIWTRRKR